MEIDKNNDFEHLSVCKHGKICRVISLEKQEHVHINFWQFIKALF